MKRERAKAQELKKSGWWKSIVAKGICHYCEKKFKSAELTMDHVVPIARGGLSVKGNVVPACRECNASKKLDTPVDQIFKQLEAERAAREEGTRTQNSQASMRRQTTEEEE